MAFIQFAPQFGAQPSGEHLEEIKRSPNYGGSTFINLIETKLDYSLSNSWGMIKDFATAKNTSPKQAIPTLLDSPVPARPDSLTTFTWYGHSAILMETENLRIFFDPMLGSAASPIPFWFGTRFGNAPGINMQSVGALDAIVLSHDHYDHLDYESIKALKDQTAHFFVPLGVGSHLRHWGVSADKITELDWWEHATLGSIKLVAAPARHFSGRGVADANKTLWASWVIQLEDERFFFSGDSGYGPHFKEIGDNYGPFDLTMMECGQYNEKWEAIHMMPWQTAQAHLDVRGKKLMAIHWGAFSLAPHAWQDPIEQLTKIAGEKGLNLVTPRIGERFVPEDDAPGTNWWGAIK